MNNNNKDNKNNSEPSDIKHKDITTAIEYLTKASELLGLTSMGICYDGKDTPQAIIIGSMDTIREISEVEGLSMDVFDRPIPKKATPREDLN